MGEEGATTIRDLVPSDIAHPTDDPRLRQPIKHSTEAGLAALAECSDSLVIELARALFDRAGTRESAEAVWARLRKREVEQMLSLTAFRPEPGVRPLTETVEQIGAKLLLEDFIERVSPGRQRPSRARVQPAELDALPRAKPTPGQLARF